jgi:small-conductance mechanosensitive channel
LVYLWQRVDQYGIDSMTEIEAYNALVLAQDQAQNIGAMLLTVLTGYLVITFFVGAKLTTFQVCFVNVVFLLSYISTWQTLIEYIATVEYFREALEALESELPLAGTTLNVTPAYSIAVACLLTIGALYFMWSVRHPKTD